MPIVRKDKVLSSYNGNLASVKIHNAAGQETKATNGVFVVSEGLLPGEREVEKGVLANADKAGEEVYLVHAPEVMYDERLNKLNDFVIEPGTAVRAYSLSNGDILTLTEDLFAGEVAEGDVLVVKENGKLGKDEAATENAKITFTVIEPATYELHNTLKSYAVKVAR